MEVKISVLQCTGEYKDISKLFVGKFDFVALGNQNNYFMCQKF